MVLSKKINRKKLKKGLHCLPNLFTLGNAFFGFCSLVFTAKGLLLPAGYFILLAALMDALDGRVARIVGSTGQFGVQIDSLCDAISFCLAPAFLFYFWQFKVLGVVGIIISAVFLFAGIMRLAKFNISHNKQTLFFLGLPTTVAGCFSTIFALNCLKINPSLYLLIGSIVLMVSLAGLMVSSVRFPTFKQRLINIKKNRIVVGFVILFAFLSVLQLHQILLLLFSLYFVSAFVMKGL